MSARSHCSFGERRTLDRIDGGCDWCSFGFLIARFQFKDSVIRISGYRMILTAYSQRNSP